MKDFNKFVVDTGNEVLELIRERVSSVYPDANRGRARWLLTGRILSYTFNGFFGQSIALAEKTLKDEAEKPGTACPTE
jgi:hypothetical protein